MNPVIEPSQIYHIRQNKVTLIDSHAHLTAKFCTDVEGTIARAKAAGVEKIVTIGTTLEDSIEGIEIAQKYHGVWAAVGIHPDSPSPSASGWRAFEKLIFELKVVTIGECGLDYKVGRENQKEVFLKQITLARKYNKPLSVHIREAQEDLMKIDLSGLRGVFHCFSGDENYLKFILKNLSGFYISFAGNVTFTNAKELQGLARMVPLERTLVETDSPFLAPHPLRGMQNEPANVKIVASKLAELHNTTLEKIAEITTKNAQELFKI